MEGRGGSGLVGAGDGGQLESGVCGEGRVGSSEGGGSRVAGRGGRLTQEPRQMNDGHGVPTAHRSSASQSSLLATTTFQGNKQKSSGADGFSPDKHVFKRA